MSEDPFWAALDGHLRTELEAALARNRRLLTEVEIGELADHVTALLTQDLESVFEQAWQKVPEHERRGTSGDQRRATLEEAAEQLRGAMRQKVVVAADAMQQAMLDDLVRRLTN